MTKLFLLFLYIALPAIIVIGPVVNLGPAARQSGLEWAASVTFMTLFVAGMTETRNVVRAAIAGLVTIFTFINLSLTVSFIIQGTPFNDAFFSHMDLTTLRIAWQTDTLRLLVLFIYIVLGPFLIWWITSAPNIISQLLNRTSKNFMRAFLVCSLILCFGVNYPISAFTAHHRTVAQTSLRLEAEIKALKLRSAPVSIEIDQPKNLVLIYLESMEQTYFDETVFPSLLPQLSALRRDAAVVFTDVRQYPGTSWTIGGIVSSQCGVPLLSQRHGNSILNEVDNPFKEITCLGEYMTRAGYRTAYIGGASLDFAGKRHFFRDNGYDSVLGIDELPNSAGHSWGMYDADLFKHATRLFDGLNSADAPFLLTVLTLDTHHPYGTPSPSCKSLGDNALLMLEALHCSDQLVSEFIRHIQKSNNAENTIIALMSDHLLIQGKAKELLSELDRRIFFMIIDPSRTGEVRDGPASHFDVAPTLLEAIGMRGAEFAFGQSLLSHPEGRVSERNLTENDFRPFTVEALTGE